MFHLVAHALPNRSLVRPHAEARRLFQGLARAFPGLVALCVLPEAVHLVVPRPDPARVAAVMSAYARWRNHARGESGPVWAPGAPAERIPDRRLRHVVRYVHLAPCRAGLVDDPLAWPWSTHRDAVGFAVPGVRAPEANPSRFHRFVCADAAGVGSAAATSPLPTGARGDIAWEAVRDAVSGVCRVPPGAIGERGTPRRLALRTAWHYGLRDTTRLAEAVGMARSGVYRVCANVPPRGAPIRDEALAACVRAVGDPRFADGGTACRPPTLAPRGRGLGAPPPTGAFP